MQQLQGKIGSYKPYGEIHRTDSSGPDITKFKYTGQEEDKESGLLYYKARYYDPMIGRFLQADSVIMPEEMMGMNRYMYVNGSPTNYRDPDGHSYSKAQITSFIFYATALSSKKSLEESFVAGFIGYEIGKAEGAAAKKMTPTKFAVGAAIAVTAMYVGYQGGDLIDSMIYPQVEGLKTGMAATGTFGQFAAARVLNAGLGVMMKRAGGSISRKLFKNDAGEDLGRNAADFGGGLGTAFGGIVGAKDLGFTNIPMDSTSSLVLPTAKLINISPALNYALESYIGCKYMEMEKDCRVIKQ